MQSHGLVARDGRILGSIWFSACIACGNSSAPHDKTEPAARKAPRAGAAHEDSAAGSHAVIAGADGGKSQPPALDAGGKTNPPVPVADAGGETNPPSLDADAGSSPAVAEAFSFFITSLRGMRELSQSDQGFGGDLRYGELTGLAGADKICTELAERSMSGAGSKGWRAFLSTAKGGPDGGPTHAKDRIGTGPWYDRLGRLIAMDLNALLQQRPAGADAAIANDLPNERGEPNHTDTMPQMDDNHDVVTATNAQGLYDGRPTCEDFTSVETAAPNAGAAGSGAAGRGGGPGRGFMHYGPGVGHSWPAMSGMSWTTAHGAPGCSPSVALVQSGAGEGTGIGNGGGYGGIYCFALKP